MTILPASSGVQELADLKEDQKLFLLNELESLAEDLNVLLIDTGAGISSNVLYFTMAAEEVIVVVTPEPTSAYGCLRPHEGSVQPASEAPLYRPGEFRPKRP